MRTFWIIVCLLLWIIWSYLLCNAQKQCCQQAATPALINQAPQDTVQAPAFVPESGPILFRWNSPDPVFAAGVNSIRDSLLANLGSNQQLKIIGHYFAGESNPTQYENLGVARAHRLKDSLFSTIPDDRCQFIGQLVSDRDGVRENLFRASEFGYAIYTETVKEIGNKAIVNFPYNSTKRINNPEVEQYLRDLAERLKKTTEKVAVTGHTCDLGADAPNMTLGMWRSEVVRDYLVSLGVESSRISIKSEGEKSPMVANTSENNRKQNRRAEIEIIQ